jgi:pimeloyl-ACP methyl ester carboxylesterase
MYRSVRTAALAALMMSGAIPAQAADDEVKPTVILVHGAFADSSGWNDVIETLEKDGYPVIAAANPLRSVAGDAESVASVVRSISGRVILVGHSYGGVVITEAAKGNANVKALVYVAGFLPDTGESALALSAKFPGSTLGDALAPVSLPGGGTDLYIQPAKFHAQFAADVPEARATLMAATQRPVTQGALTDASQAAMWKSLPSYVIYGAEDRNIPAATMKFMADRAHARKTVAVANGSHALMVSHPAKVAALIEDAATSH